MTASEAFSLSPHVIGSPEIQRTLKLRVGRNRIVLRVPRRWKAGRHRLWLFQQYAGEPYGQAVQRRQKRVTVRWKRRRRASADCAIRGRFAPR